MAIQTVHVAVSLPQLGLESMNPMDLRMYSFHNSEVATVAA